jgi:glycyl-tRNA synthetase beta chain
MAPGFRDVFDTWQRVSALAEFARADDFTAAALTFKRAANIIRKQADQSLTGKVDPALFEHTAEQEFWNTLVQVQKIWPDLTAQGNYPQMLAQLWILRPVVDNFFDEVMVMCDDARVRDNRLNMLFGLTTTLSQLADFSRLQV